jgi:xanthine dehydrogenase YagT iron-sulfur-binding subunit
LGNCEPQTGILEFPAVIPNFDKVVADDLNDSVTSGSIPDSQETPPSRRQFLSRLAAISAGFTVANPILGSAKGSEQTDGRIDSAANGVEAGLTEMTLTVNGKPRRLKVDPRVTLLDALRDRLDLTGTKKGCDRGACGACTVHVDGRRVLSCLTLAITAQGREITTIEGLATGDQLHPVQAAFVSCDGFQCGYCTPGQIMSSIGCIHEGHTGSDTEIREFMSGNLCRCAAYPNIVEAIKTAAAQMKGTK